MRDDIRAFYNITEEKELSSEDEVSRYCSEFQEAGHRKALLALSWEKRAVHCSLVAQYLFNCIAQYDPVELGGMLMLLAALTASESLTGVNTTYLNNNAHIITPLILLGGNIEMVLPEIKEKVLSSLGIEGMKGQLLRAVRSNNQKLVNYWMTELVKKHCVFERGYCAEIAFIIINNEMSDLIPLLKDLSSKKYYTDVNTPLGYTVKELALLKYHKNPSYLINVRFLNDTIYPQDITLSRANVAFLVNETLMRKDITLLPQSKYTTEALNNCTGEKGQFHTQCLATAHIYSYTWSRKAAALRVLSMAAVGLSLELLRPTIATNYSPLTQYCMLGALSIAVMLFEAKVNAKSYKSSAPHQNTAAYVKYGTLIGATTCSLFTCMGFSMLTHRLISGSTSYIAQGAKISDTQIGVVSTLIAILGEYCAHVHRSPYERMLHQ